VALAVLCHEELPFCITPHALHKPALFLINNRHQQSPSGDQGIKSRGGKVTVASSEGFNKESKKTLGSVGSE
jgi:hypothetical protein